MEQMKSKIERLFEDYLLDGFLPADENNVLLFLKLMLVVSVVMALGFFVGHGF